LLEKQNSGSFVLSKNKSFQRCALFQNKLTATRVQIITGCVFVTIKSSFFTLSSNTVPNFPMFAIESND